MIKHCGYSFCNFCIIFFLLMYLVAVISAFSAMFRPWRRSIGRKLPLLIESEVLTSRYPRCWIFFFFLEQTRSGKKKWRCFFLLGRREICSMWWRPLQIDYIDFFLLKAEQQYLIPPSRDKCLQFVQISVDDSEKASGLEITFLQSLFEKCALIDLMI